MCIIHKSTRIIYMGERVFVRVGESKKKANARVLEDVTSFLSNSTGTSNSSQQWGLKSLEETLVKNEITGYNEG
jgi:ribosomal protein S6